MKTIIYTDGSSRGNPGPGGWGSIIISGGVVQELGARDEMTTNNKMELTAAIEALRSLAGMVNATDSIEVFSDSEYVIKGITEWIHGWIKKSWKNSQRKPVLNKELWEQLLEAAKNKKIEWKYVKGHADNAGNMRCDEIATQFADSENVKLYKGSAAKYPFPEIIKNHS